MTKKSVNLRMSQGDYNYLKKNMPPQYETLSDLLRSSALAVVKGESNPAELTLFQNMVLESEERILSEIEKNRRILHSILDYMKDQNKYETQIMEQTYANQLVKIWKENLTEIKQYKTIDDLENSVKDQNLKDFVYDALLILQNQKIVKTNDHRLRWLN